MGEKEFDSNGMGSNKIARRNVETLLSPTIYIKDKNGNIKEQTNHITSNDIQFYLELSKRQDKTGLVNGVNYAEFMELLDCSKATFYNCINRLENYGLIKACPDRKGFWDITLLNNQFINKKDRERGYIRTNLDIFYTKEFKKFNTIEKKICLYLVMNKRRLESMRVYPETLAKGIGIKIVLLIKRALKSVQQFFPNEYMMGEQGVMIKFGKYVVVGKNLETEDSNYIAHKLKYLNKAHKLKLDAAVLAEIPKLAGQYIKKISYTSFVNIVNNVIHNTVVKVDNIPKFINKLCTERISILKQKRTTESNIKSDIENLNKIEILSAMKI